MKWFKHESGASNDKKLIKLRKKFGYEAIGLYWTCLEEITKGIEKSNLSFELEQDYESLAIAGNIAPEQCMLMMRYMLELRLFEYDAVKESYYCFGLARRLENSILKSPHFKQLQKDVKALLLLKNKDLSGMIPDNPGKLGLELELELELELSTTTAIGSNEFVDKSQNGPEKIQLGWCPSEHCINTLLDHALVTESFIDDYRAEFVLYWQEQGIEHKSWNTLFYRQCTSEWIKRDG